ncbi:DUF2594 family protein [Pragia fontium]|uniref:DUF2594 family protein n=1 Tax=Pragia fontium TaxID=82985 RepID=UPI000649F3D4|nr:DUF2594 family protein [Pragia fontium]AKJ43098.1 hypothetical protein QQ39_14345 [Pragia fontium]
MNNINFPTNTKLEEMANEISGLKAIMTLMLIAMGQADSGKVVLKMEKLIAEHPDQAQAESFKNIVQQIRQAYRQENC